jgi:hypothetical protein
LRAPRDEATGNQADPLTEVELAAGFLGIGLENRSVRALSGY